ncbi:MAG: OmpH family outer membrane protein [candidate division WOR-3 bacterium]
MTPRIFFVGLGLALIMSLGAKEYKVGYIDSDAIISKYEAAKEAKKELESEIAKFRAQADSLRADYERAQEEYESQELTLSEDGKRAKQAEVQQRKSRYDAFVDQVYRDGGKIDQKNDELIAPIVEKINAVVSKIAEEEGYSLVLDAAKIEVVYAQPGLDLTDEVVAELNREYAPVGPAGTRKSVYAVMPIYETNDEARQDRIGSQTRQFCYDLVRSQPNTEMVGNQKADELVQARGFAGRQIGQTEALDVARALDADYAVFGDCAKQDRKISFSLTIIDVRLGTVVRTETGETNRIEDLRVQVARAVQVLMTSVQKP